MLKKDRNTFKGRQLHKDNRGSTLVVVIVAMFLLCTLASIILYTTYINYTIKTTELHSTDNFYTAESVMEEIKAGLEWEVSNAYTDAYLYVMQNYSSGDGMGEVLRTTNFQTRYVNYLKEKFDPDGDKKLEIALLYDYLSELQTDSDGNVLFTADGEVTFPDGSYAKLELTQPESLVAYTDGVWIKGLQLTYTDQNGYVAVIATDIALRIPNMTFEEQNNLPGILAYSLIADQKLYLGVNENDITEGGSYMVCGSVYGGAKGIVVRNSQAAFKAAEDGGAYVVVTGGDVEVRGLSGSDAEFSTAGNASLWADGIIVDSGVLDLAGDSYVQDDLTVNGKNSDITLGGHYYGFGYQSVSTAARGPEDSSSILINGTGVKLDFSSLTELGLAGQAYIGTTDADEDGEADDRELIADDGSIPTDAEGNPYNVSYNMDVRMGESLSVRSNQLAYLVPPECIGYIDGECVLGSNPITLTQYQEYLAEKSPGDPEVDLSKVGLSDDASMMLSGYGASWQKVFYQAAGAGNNAWVYYYLTFNSADQANAFFTDYYSQNKAWMNSYLHNYLSEYHVPATVEKLNLAGNAVYYDDESGEFVLQPASTSTTPEEVLMLLAEYERYSNTNKALNINLTTNYAALTQDQLNRNSVFQNVVDVEKLREYMGGAPELSVTAAGGQKVVLVNNALGEGGEVGATPDGNIYVVPSDPDIVAVIATGDVKVNRNYKGMILSGGQIFVTSSARIEPDPDAVSLALQADSGRVLECFWEGKSIAGVPGGTPTPSPGAEESDVVATDELVVYRNWKKY